MDTNKLLTTFGLATIVAVLACCITSVCLFAAINGIGNVTREAARPSQCGDSWSPTFSDCVERRIKGESTAENIGILAWYLAPLGGAIVAGLAGGATLIIRTMIIRGSKSQKIP
jgi:hypothetical protein